MATLTQLEYLVAVDRYRHFGKAAKACHVSQPTLSMQLHKMEDEYGITFFDRSKQPILPTQEGLSVIEQAKAVLREMGKLDYFCRNRDQRPTGEFKLALIPTIAPYLLPLFLGSFAKRYPEVKLSIEELTTEAIIEALGSDRLDAGILATPLHIDSLVEKPLFYEPFWLYVSDKHPLSKQSQVSEDKLDAKDLWLLSEGHCLRNQIVRVCSLRGKPGIFPNVQIESGSLETLIHLVEQGHGYTLLPELATRALHRLKKNLLKPFSNPNPSREVSLVCRRTQYKQPILEALAAEVLRHLPTDLPRERSKKIEVIRI
jgi:LysR family hydrogen peroxide-inducible transcriptional activator